MPAGDLTRAYPVNRSAGNLTRTGVTQVDSEITTTLLPAINSLRNRYAGAVAPSPASDHMIWYDTSTSKEKMYDGAAWNDTVATTITAPTPNAILSGVVDATGNPVLFVAGTGLAVSLVATAEPVAISFMAGIDANGAIDSIGYIAADAADYWSSLPQSQTSYLYFDNTAGTITGGSTIVAPVYQNYAPAHAAGKHWINPDTRLVKVSNGAAWADVQRVFCGTATTNTTVVTAVSVYPYNVLRQNVTGLINYKKGANISSAATIDLTTVTGNIVHITGSTGPITAITINEGQIVDVIFDSTPTITHSAAITCPGGVDIAVKAGDRCRIVCDSANIANLYDYIPANSLWGYEPGDLIFVAKKAARTGALNCNGDEVSRTTYADLFGALTNPLAFTVTIASPAVFSCTDHGLDIGDPVRFETTGALPTGLSAGITYYVITAGLTADAFEVSTSPGGAAVNTSGTQSGTHTVRLFSWGVGDGSTTFNVPDYRGCVLRVLDDGRGLDPARVFGEYQADELISHRHTSSTVGAGAGISPGSGLDNASVYTGYTGGTETRGKNNTAKVWIKT